MTVVNQRKLIGTAIAIEEEVNLQCAGGNDAGIGIANNDDGGGHGDIDDGREVGSVDNAMTELDAALHCAVEHVDMLQRMEEENADVFTLDDELI